LTIPNMAQVLQGIFPDALEVEQTRPEGEFESGWTVKFDPQKCVMTPASWDMVSKLGRKISKMEYNVDTNQMEVYIQ